MANRNKPVEIEVVIDRSGSMVGITDDVIGGYNNWLSGQQGLPGAATVAVTLFDHEINRTQPVKLKEAKKLDRSTYVPRGSTALYDALGRALSNLEARSPEKAIVVVITDGMENASKEFNAQTIKDMIERAEKRGWQMVYLSASPSAFSDGSAIGVRNVQTFAANSTGTQSAYATASLSVTNYRNS